MIVATSSLCACASILGVDDGLPLAEGGAPDTSLADSETPKDTSVLDTNVPDTSPFSPLSCGKLTCNAVTEGCCRTGMGTDAAAMTYQCTKSAAACDPNTSLFISCERGSNCVAQDAGSVCCAFNSPATSVGCSASCDNAGNTVVCDVADDGGNCPVHEAGALNCLPSSQTLVGFTICK